jgi:hypothetical protein
MVLAFSHFCQATDVGILIQDANGTKLGYAATIIVPHQSTTISRGKATLTFPSPPGKTSTTPFTQCTTIKSTTNTDDYSGLFRFAYAVTLRAWHCIQAGATKVIGGVDNCDGNSTNCHAVTIDGNCTTIEFDNSTLNSYKAVPSGHYVGWHTTSVTGTNTWTTVCIDYTID